MGKKKATANGRHAKQKSKGRAIHVITDGTGGLPRHFMTAILSQFPDKDRDPTYHIFSDLEKIDSLFDKQIKARSIVLHALAETDSKQRVAALAESRKIPHLDLTGGAVSFIAEHTGWSAANDLERVHSHDGHYFDRIDAWEFTMQHDDSRRLETINEAEIILVGLSRVSKTPTSAYLGWMGHRVANVSFTPEIGLPQIVKKLKKRVVALTIQPKRLAEIRTRRMEVNKFAAVMNGDTPHIRYADLRDTIKEVMAAEEIYKKLKLPIIDVTDATVEETAARIMEATGNNIEW